MNTDERRAELISKANQMIDTISEAMRMVENIEGAKKRFLRADAQLSLEIPIQGTGGMSDVFKFDEIFDEKGVDKIKAYILTELEFLEEESLKILDTAGFHTELPKEQDWVDVPFTKEPEKVWPEIPFAPEEGAPLPEEDDSDMIVVPEKLEKKGHSTKPLTQDKVDKIKELSSKGLNASEIARQTGVSHQSVQRYTKKFAEGVSNKEVKTSGRSVSR